MDIRGKTVLVAGGTSGLGAGVARHFHARGANVVIVGRRGALAARIARVNTIVAGGFDTPMVDDYADEDTKAEGIRQFLNPRRLGTPDEFAALAAHIVENRYLNAANLRLDAGYRMPP